MTPITPKMLSAGVTAFWAGMPKVGKLSDVDGVELPTLLGAIYDAMYRVRPTLSYQEECYVSTLPPLITT